MTTCMRGEIYIEILSWNKRKAGREWVGAMGAYRRWIDCVCSLGTAACCPPLLQLH